MNSHQSQELPVNYIIDTDVGGDIDDALALLVAMDSHSKPLAITTTHIEPEEKAKIAKLIVTNCGHDEIPVHAGIGCKRTDPKAKFTEQNPLFPSMFGYPNPGKDEKSWYTKQALAYRETFGSAFDEMKVDKESAAECIVRFARQYSPDNKLTIVALGPLHNIAAALDIDKTIAKNIRLVAMGGTYPKGYNWLISPATTAKVVSQVETTVITNEFITKNNLFITPEELSHIIENAQSKFGKTFINDWKNWHKADHFNKKNTNLYDPITLYLAIHPNEITSVESKEINFPCLGKDGQLQPEFRGIWYFKDGLKDKIVLEKISKDSQIHFVKEVASADFIRTNIIKAISNYLVKDQIKQEPCLQDIKPSNYKPQISQDDIQIENLIRPKL